jgi:acyl-CoA reductase-like NAD-dependent aldehyde dehydrogenase
MTPFFLVNDYTGECRPYATRRLAAYTRLRKDNRLEWRIAAKKHEPTATQRKRGAERAAVLRKIRKAEAERRAAFALP